MDNRGRWYRWDTKRTTEDLLSIPISFVRKQWGLSAALSVTLTWHCGDTKTGEIGLAIYPGRGAQLDYKFNGEPVSTFVQFDYTTQPFGGRRTWWCCPGCGRRCGVLYCARLFLCRQCHRLPYRTQMSGRPLLETIDNRLYRLRRRLRATGRGITDGPPAARPRYMHWRTFERLRRQWWGLLKLRETALLVDLFSLTGLLSESGLSLSRNDVEEHARQSWQAWKGGEGYA
jgi:hypothetical protein